MINIVIPMAGTSSLASELEEHYPSPLVEIAGKPLIQLVVNNLLELGNNLSFTVIMKEVDAKKFHMDSTIRLLSGNGTNIVKLQKDTAGALCSILMAVEYYRRPEPLIICNWDQLFDKDVLREFIDKVAASDIDAATLVFESVHPRWCYVRVTDETVEEAVEKNPISNQAVAGMYYFKSGEEFSQLAMKSIISGRDIDGSFYTSSVINEYVLMGRKVVAVKVDNDQYHSLYTGRRLREYEKLIAAKRG
jgi:dTDP-glucose pyrophosphorylase